MQAQDNLYKLFVWSEHSFESYCRLATLQFTVLDNRLSELQPALRDVLNSLLDPQLFPVDRGELHTLLHHSKSLSDFYSIAKDIESTLNDVLDEEENLVDTHLTHLASTG